MDHMLTDPTGLGNKDCWLMNSEELDKNAAVLFPTSFANKGGPERDDLNIR